MMLIIFSGLYYIILILQIVICFLFMIYCCVQTIQKIHILKIIMLTDWIQCDFWCTICIFIVSSNDYLSLLLPNIMYFIVPFYSFIALCYCLYGSQRRVKLLLCYYHSCSICLQTITAL